MQLTTISAKIRLTAEVIMEIAAMLYIIAALREARFLGLNMFIENLVRSDNFSPMRRNSLVEINSAGLFEFLTLIIRNTC